MTNHKKLFIAFSATLLLSSLAGLAFAQRKVEITYPTIPNAIAPTNTQALLPDYINYIFVFAVTISALVAFGSLLYGGIRWLTSAGSSSALSDAKGRMIAGILGLAVILSSWIILNTINPQLVSVVPLAEVEWGIALYSDAGCAADKKDITRDIAPRKINPNGPNDWSNYEVIGGSYLKFNNQVPKYALEVIVNDSVTKKADDENPPGVCQSIGTEPKSIKFVWRMPGVYLFRDDGKEKFLPASTATLDDFNDRVSQVKFVDIKGVGLSSGAVLHEDPSWKGECFLATGFRGDNQESRADTFDIFHMYGKVSSVTTFSRAESQGSGGVTFYENDNFGGQSFDAAIAVVNDRFSVPPNNSCKNVPDDPNRNDWATSMRIAGSYIAVLYRDINCTGKCQVFVKSDSNFRDDEIGRCDCGLFGAQGCHDCLSSYIVLPTR